MSSPPLSVRGGARGGVIIFLITLLLSCGDITVNQGTAPTPEEGLGRGDIAIVLGADWQGTTGSISMIPLDDPSAPLSNLEITHSDAVVRVYGNRLYVVNRKGADNIQVIDPENFSTLSQFSTGVGTNPQDIATVSNSKAYVTLYEPEENQSQDLSVDDLVIFNPETGLIEKTIDLTPYTEVDGERFARASSLLLAGQKIYVAVQDLPKNLAARPDQPGKLVKIDTQTDSLEEALILTCRDPFDIAFSEGSRKIYVGCADFFDLDSAYGGVEVVDLETFRSEGILIPDNLIGGWIGGIEVTDHDGFLLVGLSDYSENRLVRFSLDDPTDLEVLYRSSGYLPEMAVSSKGQVLVCDRDSAKNGIVFIDPESGQVTAGPVSVGFPPASVILMEEGR